MNLRTLLELMRVSNLPTVWSNAVLGICVGMFLVSPSSIVPLDEKGFLVLCFFAIPSCLAMSLFYSAGMVMNDWIDRKIDATERPNRPIPSGRISAHAARRCGITMLLFGFGIVLLTQNMLGPMRAEPPFEGTIAACVLVLCIVLYNLTHQQTALSILFMGLCRSMVVITCLAIVITFDELPGIGAGWLWIAGPSATLFVYTLMISIVARHEVEGKAGGPNTIMNMIAAMPLLDAAWLVAMGLWPASLVCVGCSVLTKLGHRKVAGS